MAFMVFALLIAVQPAYAADLTFPKDTPVKVFFSPGGGCTDAINKILGQSGQEILV